MGVAVYSAEQVADILGLHVRTVRGYVRDGRLPAVRVGKQYRITESDLRAFTGTADDGSLNGLRVHVSAVAHIDNVDRAAMDRISTYLTAAAIGRSTPSHQLNFHSVYDESTCHLTVFVVGDPESAAAALSVIGDLTRSDGESAP